MARLPAFKADFSKAVRKSEADDPLPTAAAQRVLTPRSDGESLLRQPVNTFDAARLREIRKLGGGKMGAPFLLADEADTQLVVKFQKEATSRTRAAAHILDRAGANPPKVSSVDNRSLAVLFAAVSSRGDAGAEFLRVAGSRDEKYQHAVAQELAPGKDLDDLSKDPTQLFATLGHRSFQKSLGRIFAADVFSGNSDRMNPMEEGGWVHPNNLKVDFADPDNPVARPIDSDFAPQMPLSGSPWGNRGQQPDFQAVTAANGKMLRKSGRHLFDYILKYAKSPGNPDGQPSQEQSDRYQQGLAAATDKRLLHQSRAKHRSLGKTAEVSQQLAAADLEQVKKDPKQYAAAQAEHVKWLKRKFARNFQRGGTSARDSLLRRGQGWQRQLREKGIDEESLGRFRERKRYLRLLNAGLDPNDAFQAAQRSNEPQKRDQYRRLVLKHEKGLRDEPHIEHLITHPDEYKKTVGTKPPLALTGIVQ